MPTHLVGVLSVVAVLGSIYLSCRFGTTIGIPIRGRVGTWSCAIWFPVCRPCAFVQVDVGWKVSSPTPYVKISVQLIDGFLPKDMITWLEGQVGTIYDATDSLLNVCAFGWSAWGTRSKDGPSVITFHFSDVSKATLFKLTWA